MKSNTLRTSNISSNISMIMNNKAAAYLLLGTDSQYNSGEERKVDTGGKGYRYGKSWVLVRF